MRYYLSRKHPNAGTVHIIIDGPRPWSLCDKEGPWPRGLLWWVVAGFPVCKHCKRRLDQIIRDNRDYKAATRRRRGIQHD